jgi:carboxypeptidase Taq
VKGASYRVPAVDRDFQGLQTLAAELADLGRVADLLSWDEETHMPSGGAVARSEQKATIQRLAHERWTSDELASLLDRLGAYEQSLDPESDEASLIRIMRRDSEKARRVPTKLQEELVRGSSLGYQAWLRAREEQDYGLLLPQLERTLELKREYVECFAPYADPYDVLLDDYEPSLTTKDIDPVFDQLKAALPPMIHAVEDAEPVDDSCLARAFPVDAQRRFSLWLLGEWGYDPASWSLVRAVHPFQISIGPMDVRLTTRFERTGLGGVFACLHEFGHGLYERQISPSLARTPLASGVSMSLHESQSRMWENLVGRRIATWRFAYPRLQSDLTKLVGVPLETFHRAINKVERSLVRVEADEVTYNLHIILRYELEREVLSGSLPLRDLPEAFDAKMLEYLGLTPPDVVSGVLQDLHWSDLGFGYFPTYALGNVLSVQIWERAEAELGDLDAQFERGEFAPLREWLGERLHRHGRKFTARETLELATAAQLDPAPYIGYLGRKLEDLFGAVVVYGP